MSNRSMIKAKREKNDEFYTQLSDIENEMRHYKPHFEDKIVYMNTDHPDRSNFWLFFKLQFNHLKLKKIIATFWDEDGEVFMTEYDGVNEKRTPLKGDGDFRSDECVEILKESDIVVTNPPFSLFREFVNLIIANKKQFIILGTVGVVTNKDFFPRFKNNEVWPGVGFNKTMKFKVPKHYNTNKKGVRLSDGSIGLSVSSITWWTNLDYPKRHEDMILWSSYEGSEHEYPEYDNYKAINIDKVANIPYDYDGIMGVPVTFIGRWNPSQFEIIGAEYDIYSGSLKELRKDDWTGTFAKGYIDGKRKYDRIFIKNKKPRKTLIPED